MKYFFVWDLNDSLEEGNIGQTVLQQKKFNIC